MCVEAISGRKTLHESTFLWYIVPVNSGTQSCVCALACVMTNGDTQPFRRAAQTASDSITSIDYSIANDRAHHLAIHTKY